MSDGRYYIYFSRLHMYYTYPGFYTNDIDRAYVFYTYEKAQEEIAKYKLYDVSIEKF